MKVRSVGMPTHETNDFKLPEGQFSVVISILQSHLSTIQMYNLKNTMKNRLDMTDFHDILWP